MKNKFSLSIYIYIFVIYIYMYIYIYIYIYVYIQSIFYIYCINTSFVRSMSKSLSFTKYKISTTLFVPKELVTKYSQFWFASFQLNACTGTGFGWRPRSVAGSCRIVASWPGPKTKTTTMTRMVANTGGRYHV